jgi:type I restriction enzyme S subunit
MEIERSAHGSAQANISPTAIEQISTTIPPLTAQRAIARILNALDDKIELNRQMNETLEALARALFQSWFVDFDPVRAKMRGEQPVGMDANTAALFPSRLVQTEHGEVPEGWPLGTIGDIAINRREVAHPRDIAGKSAYLGLEHFPRGRLFFEDVGSPDDLESQKSRFHKGDILFGKLRPYFKKVGLAAFEGVCSTDVLVLSPKRDARAFTLLLVAHDAFIDHAVALSDGTRMPRTSWEQVNRFVLPMPPIQVVAAFERTCEPFFEMAEANRRESKTLAATRDLLLPRLLSGELRVPDAERLVAEAV